jgi:cytoskeletal protein RodZ
VFVLELGQKLQEARQTKGLSLDELQEITKIQKRYLTSIEEGKLHILPGEFYVRAFIKQYAEAVGLDAEMLLEEHKNELPLPPASHDITQLSRVRKSREAVSTAASNKFMDYMPKVFITLIVLAVCVGVWLVFQALANKEESTAIPEVTKAQVEKAENSPLDKKEEPKEEVKKEEAPVAPPQPVQELKVIETSGKIATMELRNNTAMIVELTAKGRAYIDIKDGSGKLIISKTLQPGETLQQDLSAQDTMRLNVGSTPNTDIKINGQAVSYPQDPTKYYHQILLIKNLRTAQSAQ